MVQIIQIDPIMTKVDKQSIDLIRPCLSFKSFYWQQSQYRKIRKEYTKYLINKDGSFLAGLTPRVKKYLKDQNIVVNEVFGYLPTIQLENKPSLQHYNLRDDQLQLINRALLRKRGVLKAPTGIGKTILALGILSCFPLLNALFLVREGTLLNQTIDELKLAGFKDIRRFGGGVKDELGGVTVSTIQSLSNLDPSLYCDKFEIVIVDECHIAAKINSENYKVLTNLLAEIRIGLTATLPTNPESLLVLEGLLGPVIGEMTIQKGIESNLLAKPRIQLLKVPMDQKVRDLRNYSDVYNQGIVKNEIRNELIVKKAKEYLDKGLTILILVSKINHGENIAKLAKELFNWNIPFIFGDTDIEERNKIKKNLIDKVIPCVIADNVWRHGVNIPSLRVLINAAGEKSEVSTMQRLGRGFRKTIDKDEIIIIDFFDQSHPYLVNHFGHRVCLYMEEGWI